MLLRRTFAVGVVLVSVVGCRSPISAVLIASPPKPPATLDPPPVTPPSAPRPASPAPSPSPPPAEAPPAQPGASGGGGSAVGPTVTGTVTSLASGLAPIAGARVATSDGRSALTDAQGRFTLAGAAPADGAYVVSHTDHVASAVVGLDGASGLSFHLQPRVAVAATQAEPTVLTAHGRMLDETGAPLEGVLVTLQDGRGSASDPVVTDATGDFTLNVRAVDGRVEDGTLLAAGPIDAMHLAVATGLSLAGPGGLLTLSEGADPETLRMTPADHTVRVDLAPTEPGATVLSTLSLVGPHGEALGVPAIADVLQVAKMPGARYELRVETIDSYEGVQAFYQSGAIALADGPETHVPVTLLAAPDVQLPSPWTDVDAVTWSAVPGARGYVARLANLDGGTVWEGFTTTPAFSGVPVDGLAAGRYGFTVTAWDDDGAEVRQVAGVAGARRLKLPEPLTGRYTWRQVRFTR